MNYIVKNGNLKLTPALATFEEAEAKLKSLSMLYPKATIEQTDANVVESGLVLTAPPEEQEDVGCAGGACTL